MLALIGPMKEEVEEFFARIPTAQKKKHAGMILCEGRWCDEKVILVQCGVGKVNAAMATQYLIDHYDIDAVIGQGVAGALDPSLETGDIVLASELVQHDLDASPLGFARGQIPYTDTRIFHSNQGLLKRAQSACQRLGYTCISGTVVTGDKFITESVEQQELRECFGAVAVEMEGAAIAQVCTAHDVPFLIVRSISDKADHSATVDFPTFLTQSAVRSCDLVEALLLERDPALSTR